MYNLFFLHTELLAYDDSINSFIILLLKFVYQLEIAIILRFVSNIYIIIRVKLGLVLMLSYLSLLPYCVKWGSKSQLNNFFSIAKFASTLVLLEFKSLPLQLGVKLKHWHVIHSIELSLFVHKYEIWNRSFSWTRLSCRHNVLNVEKEVNISVWLQV